MSFSINRTGFNKPVKKTINLTTTPKISSNRAAFSNPNSVNLEQLSLNNILINTNANSLNSLNTTAGIADSNKALITDSNNNIANINTIECNSLTVNNSSVTGLYENSNPSNSNVSYIKGTTSGISDYNKLMITDSNKNIKNINSLNTSELKIQNNSLKLNNNANKSKFNITFNRKYITPETFTDLLYISSLNLFIGCSSTKIYRSTNSYTWTTVYTNTDFNLKSITYSSIANIIIVISNKDIIKSSNNGVNWSVQNITTLLGNNVILRSCAWSPTLNLFNIISWYQSGSSHECYVIRSSDGTSWLNTTNLGIAWTSTIYVQIANNLSWNSTQNQFEILGLFGYGYSTNGISWTLNSMSTLSSTNQLPILWSSFIQEYIGTFGSNPSRSSTITSLTTAISNGVWKSTFLGEIPSMKIFIALENNTIIYTYDFITWIVSNKCMYSSLSAIRNNNILNTDNSQLYIFNNYILSLEVNKINTYLDLTYYDTINTSINAGIKSICYAESLNLYVAISNTNPNQQIITSQDGYNWILRNTPTNNWNKIVYSNQLNRFICIADSGNDRIMESSDGINWNTNTISYSNFYKPILSNTSINIYSHALVLMNNGTIKAWGDGSFGRLGNNSLVSSSAPVNVSGITNAIAVSTGAASSLALLSDGTIKAWGYNGTGELGNNSTTNSSIPVNVSDITNAIAISIKNSHGLALLSDGTIKSWGRNNLGQLGNNSTTNSSIPVNVSGITNAIAIVAGSMHSLALLSDGTIKAWGNNANGQLGDNSTTQRNTPTTVSGISNAIAIAAGSDHSLALLSDGTIKAWGYNTTGQLGDNSTIQRNTPVTVSNISNAITISANKQHSLALLSDGTIKAWGYNFYGQLGNNSTTNSYIPVTVSGISNAIAISAGNDNSMALLNNNTLVTWGNNTNGVLGDGSGSTQKNIPVYCRDYAPNSSSKFILLTNIKTNNESTADLSFKNYNWTDIVWSNKLQLFVAIANSTAINPILTSSDGLTWTSKIVPFTYNWTNINTINDSGFIIYSIVETTSSEKKTITSTDGQIWLTLIDNTSTNITLSSINSLITSNINNNIYILQNQGKTYIGYSLTINSSNLSLYIASDLLPLTYYNKNNRFNNEVLYKGIYIEKLNQFIIISPNSNKIYIAYNQLTNLIDYTLPYISEWSDIIWNENLNSLILTSKNSTKWHMIKSKDLSLINPLKNLSTNPNISQILYKNFANRLTNILPDFYSSSSILNIDIQEIEDLNNYYAFTSKYAYSPELQLLITYSSSTINIYKLTINTFTLSSTISYSGFSNTCLYWCKQLKLFFLGNSNTSATSTRIMTSYDGLNWAPRYLDTNLSISSLIYNFEWIEKQQIMVAYTGSSSGSIGGITSTDGITWNTSSSLFYTNGNSSRSGCYSPELNLIVILSLNLGTIYYGTPFTSLTTLSSVPNLSSDTLNYITWIPQLSIFIILTNTTKIGISSNGINWYTYSVPVTFNNVTWLNSKQALVFTTAASSNTPVYICNFYSNSLNLSDNINNKFLNYTNDSLNNMYSQNTPNTNAWKSVTYSGDLNLFVAISNTGVNNRIMTSDNGINWISRSSPADNDWSSICWSSELDLFVAVANSGIGNRIMTSPDGINWTIRSSPVDNNWTSVCWSEDLLLFVAVSNTGTNNRVMTSSNGIDWTLRSTPIDNNWTSVCWGNNGLFVAVSNSGTNNRIMTSSNGINWTIQTSPANNNWSSICWANHINLFIAVASSGTNNRIMTSSNGLNWNLITNTINNNWSSICYAQELNLVVAISNTNTNGIIKSTDGINWNSISIPNKNWESICWSQQLGIFVSISSSQGNNDVIISNITLNGIHNTISTINPKCIKSINNYSKNLIIGDTNNMISISTASNVAMFQIASNINNETMRLTYNNSATNNVDFNVNADASQLDIITNGTNKIFNLENHNLISQGLSFNGTLLTASINDINKLIVTPGIAESSKIIVVDNNKDISNLNTVTANKCLVNNSFVLSNNDNNSSYIQNITPGTSEASKCLVVDSNRNLSNINEINANSYILNNTTINNSTILDNYKFEKSFNNGIYNNYPSNIQVRGGCWSSELGIFVVVGSGWHYPSPINGSFSPIMISKDGINWEGKMVTHNNITLNAICWSPELNLFVTVGNNGYIYSSKDGNIWTPRQVSGSTYNSIAWSSSLNLFVAIGNNLLHTSSDGITWTSRTSPANVNWTDIVWASSLSLFVIVSNTTGSTTNQIATSSTGTSWMTRTSPISNEWNSITWSPSLNLFISVASSGTSNNRVMSSSDGITWTVRTSFSQNWLFVTWISYLNIFVASPNMGTIFMKSSDGINWELINSITSNNFYFKTIIASSELNITITGGLNTNYYTNTRILYSSNLTNWTIVNTNYNGWASIKWIPENNIYLGLSSATPNRSMITKSSDGINWILYDSNIASITSLDFIFYNYIWVPTLNLYIAGGSQTRILRSLDTITWTLCTLPSITSFNNLSFAWSSSLNLIIILLRQGISNSQLYTSSNGITWTKINMPEFTTKAYKDIEWIPNLNMFIACSNNGKDIIYSTNGVNWTNLALNISFFINSLNWIHSLQKFILIPASGTTYAISSDGLNWSEKTSTIFNYLNISYTIMDNFIWINEYNILINIASNTGLYKHILVYTTDLLTWNVIPLPFHNNILYNKIVYSSSLKQLIIYTNDEYRALIPFITYNLTNITDLSLSTNLSNISNLITPNSNITNNSINNWSTISFTYSNNLTSICYSKYLQLFVAVANTGVGNRIITSSNGISWTARTSAADNNWTSICWSPKLQLFASVANSGTNNRVMTSPNGTAWTARTSAADNNWTSICWSEELNIFIAVANSGTNNRFMHSTDGLLWDIITVNNNNNWTSICWSPELGLFVAVANSGTGNRIITSTDGLTWTTRSNPVDNNWTSVCWSNDLSLFVAVANTGTSNRIMTSSDGITWISRVNPVDNNWTSVVWASEIKTFVAVANSGTGDRIMTSSDGITWSTKSNSVDNDWTSVCWNSDLNIFIAVSSTGTNNRILSSNNNNITNTSIISNNSVIKTNQTSFKLTQDTNRVGLGINTPNYQLHLSNSTAAKPGTSTWTVSSDRRLKENIENADLDICYNNIKNLPLKRYKWKDDIYNNEQVPDRHKLGWIAQDVEQILPKSVNTINQFNIEDCKTLNTDQIIANMHGCTKKLLNTYENQQIRINKLVEDINNLKTFINNNLTE